MIPTLTKAGHYYPNYLTNGVVYRPSEESIEAIETAYRATLPRITRTYLTGYCSCVIYLETKFPQISSIGLGSNWPVNAQIGSVGDVLVFVYPHVAQILFVLPNGYILDEANYVRCSHTTDRFVSFDDPTIKGIWKP